ncbi:NmrA family NAD(P)-binding protein [Mucilaginibacter celer]|uniref:NAD-dependent epimerase/dehydratase family protein n=1 Tax=Mucilaginibacter celer TaxID=2305508 RepID=A0A494VMV7_9SPHI|nr:NmrA family NAD(P)-binding protein [Mucilaginibacter celer]AYL94300.1 NAD-dependent epimerase/dehydratase family protein [Mucilaginibacter celer]
MEKKVLITGATGVTGKHAIANLLKMNIPVRALVHRLDERSEALAAQGVEVVEGDLSDFNRIGEVLQDIRAAYYLFPIQVPGIIESTAYFAQAALENGVEAIVNMSQVPARRTSVSHGSQNHWVAERVFDKFGVPVTHLKPTFFAEWLLYSIRSIKTQDALIYPFGDVAYAPITGEDQGRVIASILSNPAPHAGKTYPLFGLEELTQYQIADMVSEVIGRKITYQPVEIPDFEPILRTAMRGNDYFTQHILAVAQDCRDGYFSGTNNYVEEITGQKPMSMMDFIVKYKTALL